MVSINLATLKKPVRAFLMSKRERTGIFQGHFQAFKFNLHVSSRGCTVLLRMARLYEF